MRATARVLGRLLLLASVAAPVRVLAQETFVQWTMVSQGEKELAAGQAFDLDFGDLKRSEPDFVFEPWEGGTFWAPSHGTGAAIMGVADFVSFPMARADGAQLSRTRIYLCGGAEPVQAGTVIVSTTSDARFSKVLVTDCGSALKFRWVTYDRQVLVKKPEPGGLVAPAQTSPPDTSMFDHDPRDLLLTWRAVGGARSYKVELDCLGCCGPRREHFCTEQENGKPFLARDGIPTTAFYTVWSGVYAGRWRVAAVGEGGRVGPWSPWWRFTFTR